MNPVIDAYLARTPRSRELFERATASLPGGSTRTTIFTVPYPPYMVHGDGIRTWDVDAAVERQVRRGSAFAAPTETEIELAEEIRRRLPSIEAIRFTNSGTEATMSALRAARAFTGRSLVGKFESAYHGTHDTALAWSPGVPPAVSDQVIELPWADVEAIQRAISGREREIAAIIVEPVQGA